MVKTLRAITRSGLAERLGLWSTDLNPRRGSRVHRAVTQFYNAEGDTLGTHSVTFDTISGGWDHDFHIMADTAEPEAAHSSLWL